MAMTRCFTPEPCVAALGLRRPAIVGVISIAK
jgi:hypothetical protein